jgi:hypothetical protein
MCFPGGHGDTSIAGKGIDRQDKNLALPVRLLLQHFSPGRPDLASVTLSSALCPAAAKLGEQHRACQDSPSARHSRHSTSMGVRRRGLQRTLQGRCVGSLGLLSLFGRLSGRPPRCNLSSTVTLGDFKGHLRSPQTWANRPKGAPLGRWITSTNLEVTLEGHFEVSFVLVV